MAQSGPRDKATIESLKERMARDPLSRAFLQLAEEYRKAGRFEEAVQVCNEGLARHPGYHTARIALGRTFLDAGDLDSAHHALTEVLDTMPENHLAGKLLAEVQLRLGNRAGAAETYRAILSHYPGDQEVEGLLNEIEGGDGGPRPTSPEPPAGPDAGNEVPTGLAGATDSEMADLAPPPLEVVDGGEPALSPPPDDGDSTCAAGPEDHGGAGPRSAANERPTAMVDPWPEPAPAPPEPIDMPSVTSAPAADALQTNTLAELYLRQGLVEKALDVYRAMLQVDPDNERARRRLLELAGEGAVSDATEPPRETVLPSEPMPPEAIAAPGPATSFVDDLDGEPSGTSVPTSSEVVEPSGLSEGEPELNGDLSQALDSPEAQVSFEPPVRQGSTVAVNPPTAATTATIERLERWLQTIQSGSTPAAGESRR